MHKRECNCNFTLAYMDPLVLRTDDVLYGVRGGINLNRAIVVHAEPTGGDKVLCCQIRSLSYVPKVTIVVQVEDSKKKEIK